MSTTRHVSIGIEVSAKAVYEYASNPVHLPDWAAGLARSELTHNGSEWTFPTPAGTTSVRFADTNEFGIIDHFVTTPHGEIVYMPGRVIPNEDKSCDVVLTVRQGDMTDEQFELDVAAVTNDLRTLKSLLEAQ